MIQLYLPGLMADKSGNYIASFLIAGGVGIIASLVPLLLLWVEREPTESIQHIDAVEDQGQSEDADKNADLKSIITDQKDNAQENFDDNSKEAFRENVD